MKAECLSSKGGNVMYSGQANDKPRITEVSSEVFYTCKCFQKEDYPFWLIDPHSEFGALVLDFHNIL